MPCRDVEIAPHLKYREVACPCAACKGIVAPMHFRLLNAFTQLRQHWGKSIQVVSGYRCPGHNQDVGGSPTSAHLRGMALDVSIAGQAYLDDEFLRLLIICGFTGIGRAAHQLHLDVREQAYMWRYRGQVLIADQAAKQLYDSIMGEEL